MTLHIDGHNVKYDWHDSGIGTGVYNSKDQFSSCVLCWLPGTASNGRIAATSKKGLATTDAFSVRRLARETSSRAHLGEVEGMNYNNGIWVSIYKAFYSTKLSQTVDLAHPED